jgi:hypothetical protein
MKKRIALVAALALGTGVMSVAPANATAIVAEDVTVVSTSKAIICANTSVSTTQSVVIPSNSSGVVLGTTGAAVSETAYFKVSGPGVISAGGTGVTIVSQTEASAVVHSTPADTTITVKPTGVGTIKVAISDTSTSALLDLVTITSVATCSGGKFSAVYSSVAIVSSTVAATADASWSNTNVDTADYDIINNGDYGYIKLTLFDDYAAALASDAAIATTTAGCVVGLANYGDSLAPGLSATAVKADTMSDDVVIVGQATADAPAKCTVTVTYAGTVVTTKAFTMLGAPAKVEVAAADITVGARSGGYGYFRAKVTDSAGNPLHARVVGSSSTNASNVAALPVVSAIRGGTTSSTITGGSGKTPAIELANLASAAGRFTCTAKGGTASITVRVYTDASSTTSVTSAPFTVLCGGASLDTWAISLDKASYTPGEIATLTLTGKDGDGFLVNSLLSLSGVEYSFGGMTAVTAPTNGDLFASAAGVKTYKFAVGTTEGSFVGTFKTTGDTDTAAKTLQYAVKSSTTSVSNADVLKSIVALIASINKQIQALQKLILARR